VRPARRRAASASESRLNARGRDGSPRPFTPNRDPQPPPDRIIAVLKRAQAAELVATGRNRIPSFRTTRALLGGACALGYTPSQLAGCLGMRTETLRNRASADDWIEDRVFAELADRRLETVRRWQRQGRLPNRQVDGVGRCYYPASDLLRALSGRIGQ
jgi:hypothetical protein